MKIDKTKVLVVGSGPAGYTAAIYAARACLDPVLVAGSQKGGQLSITTDVENYPGFAEPIQGPWLMEQMEGQAKFCGVNIIEDDVSSIEKITESNLSSSPFLEKKDLGEFIVKLDGGREYIASTVIVCTGAKAKWLGLESEAKFLGYGVSGCATCDGFFFRGKEVLVIGGGNTAVEEALYLTNHASKVTLVHRRDSLRAEKTLQNRLLKHEKISIIWDSVLEEVLGTERPSVTGARIRNVKTNQISDVDVEGIFIAIGHEPNTSLITNFKELNFDKFGYLVTKPNSTGTEVEGLFAAGDIQDGVFRQAVTAAGTGCMAALEAERYLASR